MTAIMERPTDSTQSFEPRDLASLYREGLEWRTLVTDTILEIIREAAAEGGALYHDVLSEIHCRLAHCYPEHNHDKDFFDAILNQLSIDRQIDSGRGTRLFVEGEQPWLSCNRLAGAAIGRAND